MMQRFLILSPLLFMGLLLTYDLHLRKLHNQISIVKVEFQNALFDRQAQLTRLVREVSNSHSLTQNINWQLEYSIQKYIETHLVTGELENITIFNNNCEEIASSGFSAQPPCNADIATEHFLLYDFDGDSILGVSVGLANYKTYRIIGSSALNLSDLINTPSLTLKLALTFEPAPSEVILLSNKIGDSTLNLTSKNFLLSLHPALRYKPNIINQWVYLFLAFVFLGALAQWRRRLWVAPKPSFMRGAHLHRAGATAINATHSARIDLQKKVTELEKQVSNLNLQIGRANQTIEKIQSDRDLSNCFINSFKGIENNHHLLRSKIEDLSDILTHGAYRSLQVISSTLKSWRTEIALRGAHRFLRYLSETKSQTGKSFLDFQIGAILSNIETMESMFAGVTIQTDTLRNLCDQNLKTLRLWQKLKEDETGLGEVKISSVLIDASQLFNSNDKSTARIRTFQIGDQEDFTLPKIGDARLLTLSFLYAYSAMDDILQNNGSEISTHLKTVKEIPSVILSCPLRQKSSLEDLAKNPNMIRAIQFAGCCGLSFDIRSTRGQESVLIILNIPLSYPARAINVDNSTNI